MRVAVHTEIAAPRQRVWDYIVDPDRHVEFMEGMTRWEVDGVKRTGPAGNRQRLISTVARASSAWRIETTCRSFPSYRSVARRPRSS